MKSNRFRDDDSFDVRRPGPTVLLAEREPALGHRRAMLEREGFRVVAATPSAEEAIDVALASTPALCVVSAELPSSLDAVREIHAQLATEIAVLSEHDDRREALTWIRAGAHGFLPRSISDKPMAAALRGMVAGRPAVPRSVATLQIDEAAPAEPRLERRGPINRTVFYLPRFLHHLRRRRRSHMPWRAAWGSARRRMLDYRG